MTEGFIVLLIVLIIGITAGNDLVAWAAGTMLVMRFLRLDSGFEVLEAYGVKFAVLLMFIGVLIPFAQGKLGFSDTANTLFSRAGILAIILGAVAAILASMGVQLLTLRPEVLIGLIIGSIIGVAFLGGIPAGPFVTAGLAALLYQVLKT